MIFKLIIFKNKRWSETSIKYNKNVLERINFFIRVDLLKFKTKNNFFLKSITFNKFSMEIAKTRSKSKNELSLFGVKIESKFNIVNKIRIIPNRIYFFKIKTYIFCLSFIK